LDWHIRKSNENNSAEFRNNMIKDFLEDKDRGSQRLADIVKIYEDQAARDI